MIDKINQELVQLDPQQLDRVLSYVRTLRAEQPGLFDTTKKCIVCKRAVYKPKRGPWPKFCGPACRQKQYRQAKSEAEWQSFISN